MGFLATFTEPYYGGSGSAAAEVPSRYPVGLAGRGYMLDLKSQQFRHSSIPILRPQQDTSEKPSERSLNPEGLWRAGQDSWHRGAGQAFTDRPDSDPFRFRSSKGVDVWTKWQMALLADTERKVSTAAALPVLLPVGPRLYCLDGQVLKYLTDVLTAGAIAPTTVTGNPAATAQDVTSDGFNVYVAYGSNGVYKTDRASGAQAAWNATSVTVVDFVKGRLMAANGPTLYNITGVAAPTYSYAHPNGDFAWVGFAGGPRYIYAAGYSGDKAEVYKIGIKADGTGLDVPIHAIPGLPDGEVVRSIDSYLGFILLGTDKGARLCTPDANGDLVVGSLIPTTSAVQCFEGQDRFVWFGETNYDTGSTGLGRMDLRELLDESTPVYASDLMATAQGAVVSVATFQNRRVFGVAGSGIWAETANKVAAGTLDGGYVMYGVPDNKVALFLEAEYESFPAGSLYRAWVSAQGGAFTVVGTYDGTTEKGPFPVGQLVAARFEIRDELVRSTTDATKGPVLTRHTLLSQPVTDVGHYIFLPVLLEPVEEIDGTRPMQRDVAGERAFLKELRRTQQMVVYQEGTEAFSVQVADYQWQATKQTPNRKAYGGTMLLKLKVVA